MVEIPTRVEGFEEDGIMYEKAEGVGALYMEVAFVAAKPSRPSFPSRPAGPGTAT